jgi:hypothetical protein
MVLDVGGGTVGVTLLKHTTFHSGCTLAIREHTKKKETTGELVVKGIPVAQERVTYNAVSVEQDLVSRESFQELALFSAHHYFNDRHLAQVRRHTVRVRYAVVELVHNDVSGYPRGDGRTNRAFNCLIMRVLCASVRTPNFENRHPCSSF